jgi:hypothetical protein
MAPAVPGEDRTLREDAVTYRISIAVCVAGFTVTAAGATAGVEVVMAGGGRCAAAAFLLADDPLFPNKLMMKISPKNTSRAGQKLIFLRGLATCSEGGEAISVLLAGEITSEYESPVPGSEAVTLFLPVELIV